jgi:hypothetical protein
VGPIEIKYPGRNFTWSNNKECPILAALDRILVSMDWESKYPLARVTNLPKGVSDYNPLMINFGDKNPVEAIFRFEKWWLETEGFSDLVKKCWKGECHLFDPMDI